MAKNDHTTFGMNRTFDFQSFDWTVFGQLIITVIIIINKRCLHAKPVTGFGDITYYQSYMIVVICDSLN